MTQMACFKVLVQYFVGFLSLISSAQRYDTQNKAGDQRNT